MAEDKKGFLMYADWIKTIDLLSDEQAGVLLKHLLRYVNDENPETNDPLIMVAFEPIKQQLKRDLRKWDGIKEKRSLAGKASAEAKKLKKEQDATKSTSVESVEQTPTKSTVSDNVNVNVIVNDNVIKEKEIAFNFRKSLLKYGFACKIVDDWLKVRKNKKATNTKTALDGFIKEVEKSGKDKNEILKICVEKSWSGFNASWLDNMSNGEKKVGGTYLDTTTDYSKAKL